MPGLIWSKVKATSYGSIKRLTRSQLQIVVVELEYIGVQGRSWALCLLSYHSWLPPADIGHDPQLLLYIPPHVRVILSSYLLRDSSSLVSPVRWFYDVAHSKNIGKTVKYFPLFERVLISNALVDSVEDVSGLSINVLYESILNWRTMNICQSHPTKTYLLHIK